MSLLVRLAGLEDAADLARIHATGFDEPWPETDFRDWLSRPLAFAVVAASERDAVAFGLVSVSGDDAELLTIATLPAARGAGAGKSVLQALDAEAARRGLARWVLEVARNNLAAIALYRSQGFVEIAVRPKYYRQAQGRVDALVMARPVGA